MSLTHTKAYVLYKSQSGALLDFAVLVAHSMPALRDEIGRVKLGTLAALPRPDFFHKSNRSTSDDLLRTEAKYEQYLASYVLLAHFSFFEAFVETLITEMINFHGGADRFLARAENRLKRFMAFQSPNVTNLKRKLQDSDKPQWRDRYRKFSRELEHEGFRFPGELLAAYGVRNLILKIKNLKAVHIPNVLVEAPRVDLSTTEIKTFHKIRETRNAVAHGGSATLNMRQTIGMNRALRGLAVKISSHVADNFFVIEKYIP